MLIMYRKVQFLGLKTINWSCGKKVEKKKLHTAGKVPNIFRKIVVKGTIYTLSTRSKSGNSTVIHILWVLDFLLFLWSFDSLIQLFRHWQHLRKGMQFLIHKRRSSFCSSCKQDDNSYMRKEPRSVYDKWNVSMVICDTYIT